MSAKGNLLVAVVAGVVTLVMVSPTTLADVPRQISYQGRLTGNGDDPVNLQIRFYDAETGGNELFFEEHTAVPRPNGLFSINIGSQTTGGVPDSALDYTLQNPNSEGLWLGVKAWDGSQWIELTPRTAIVMVPFAAKATSAEQLVRPGSLDPMVHLETVNDRSWLRISAENAASDNPGLAFMNQAGTRQWCLAQQSDQLRMIDMVNGVHAECIWTLSGDMYLPRGRLGVGTSSPNHALDVQGTTRTHVLQITGGSDLAEPFAVAKPADKAHVIQPGMVVVIDPDNPGKLMLATEAYDRKVAGVISGAGGVQPGMIMKQEGHPIGEGEHPIAMAGKVYVWCDASYGPITPGDRLTTSDTPGHATKVTDHQRAPGAVIGKAMTCLIQGKGLVLVLVQPQ